MRKRAKELPIFHNQNKGKEFSFIRISAKKWKKANHKKCQKKNNNNTPLLFTPLRSNLEIWKYSLKT